MIRIKGLSHDFGTLAVLRDLNLTVASGEIVAVLGPSGCGKSTLLNLISGLASPKSGSILIASAARLGRVFQDPTLLPWRSVAANVGLPLERQGITAAARNQRVAAALTQVGLGDFAGYLPKTLSGGMAQRVNLARALAVAPSILLMDEPLSGLDEPTRDALLADLLRLWSDLRCTCLYVTHSPLEAVRLGHRVVVLSERPARLRGSIDITLPHADRDDSHPEILAALRAIRQLSHATSADSDAADAL
ncbi:MAG: ABC transporter ATP-binding protein [bacterium]